MERILIQQIVNAIEENFLKAFHYQTTNRITKKILDILNYLIDTYGDISPQVIETLRDKLNK